MMKFIAILLAVVSSSKLSYHKIEIGNPCNYVEFDADKCPGMIDFLTTPRSGFWSGSCPSMYAEGNCGETELKEKETAIETMKLKLDSLCSADTDFSYNLLCEPRKNTYHKIDESNGLCVMVDFDRFECNNLSAVLSIEDGFIPGPCPDSHTYQNCDPTTRLELDAVALVGRFIYSAYCNLDTDDVFYNYFCEAGNSAPKCPKECADAIAAADKEADFCYTIMQGLHKGMGKHPFPDACSDLGETTVGLCMPELYEKCVPESDDYLCPIPEYGLPPVLKECEPTTCEEWKEAVDTGCAKDVSACLKDELQGKLECTKHGKKLPKSSSTPCSESKACATLGEFCSFDDDLETGECELCSITVCELLSNDKAKAECRKTCNPDCTTDIGCMSTCKREPETCKQLEDTMESATGCGKTCNQCFIDRYNAKLECKGGDKVQSRMDGDSASALSILMLATVAVFLWV